VLSGSAASQYYQVSMSEKIKIQERHGHEKKKVLAVCSELRKYEVFNFSPEKSQNLIWYLYMLVAFMDRCTH